MPKKIDKVVEAPLPRNCPSCKESLEGTDVPEDERVYPQYVSDIPVVRPYTIQYNVHGGHCPHCGKWVQGRDEGQISDALGAAGVQVGPNAHALAAEMKHRLGLSYGKIRDLDFFKVVFGLEISRGGLSQSGKRVAQKAEATHRDLVEAVRRSSVIHSDETGWRIGGHNAWLWVFTNKHLTIYEVSYSRGHEVAEGVLGANYDGVIVSDCYCAYDPLEYKKGKCAGHLLKSLSEIVEMKRGRAVVFGREAMGILRDAMALKERVNELSSRGYAMLCGKIEARMDRLLAGDYRDEDNNRLAKRLRKHRDSIFTFLYREEVEATNNRAERALRPAVIARRLSAGNRTETGAWIHGVLASVIETCRQQGIDVLEEFRQLLQAPEPVVIPLVYDTS